MTSQAYQNASLPGRSFGNDGTDNEEKLTAFIEAVNSSDGNSHLVTVPAGTILSDQLFGSPIYQHDGGAGYAAGPRAAAEVPNFFGTHLMPTALSPLSGADPPCVHCQDPSCAAFCSLLQ